MEEVKMVKLAIHPAFSEFRYLGETAFGVEELAQDGQEEVAQKWIAADGGDTCLTFINDTTYASSCMDGTLYQTLIKSCGYSAHPMSGRVHVPTGRYIQGSDHVGMTYRFFLNGGNSKERLAAVSREAQLHCEEPVVLACFSGSCPNSKESFMEISNPAVVCSAVKAAENGSGWVLRLFNSTGEKQNSSICCGGKAADVSLAPWEIKTLLWNKDAAAPAETNLLEQFL